MLPFTKDMKKVILFLVILFFFSFGLVFAEEEPVRTGIVPCGPGTGVHCTLCHFFEMLGNIVNFIYIIAVPIAVLMITIGGILMSFTYINPGAGGEPLTRAREIFKSVAIGLLIIWGAWLVINLFFYIITGDTSWYEIQC